MKLSNNEVSNLYNWRETLNIRLQLNNIKNFFRINFCIEGYLIFARIYGIIRHLKCASVRWYIRCNKENRCSFLCLRFSFSLSSKHCSQEILISSLYIESHIYGNIHLYFNDNPNNLLKPISLLDTTKFFSIFYNRTGERRLE